MTTEVPLAACPSCKGPVEKGAEHRPFCSDRCRLVDLGRWMNEDFVVSRPLREDDRHRRKPNPPIHRRPFFIDTAATEIYTPPWSARVWPSFASGVLLLVLAWCCAFRWRDSLGDEGVVFAVWATIGACVCLWNGWRVLRVPYIIVGQKSMVVRTWLMRASTDPDGSSG
ncbi:MAG: DNA gyrase inhibitor YacG, partial [Planctomycetota bacterium]